MGVYIGVLYWDNGKENGNYYNGLYRDSRVYTGVIIECTSAMTQIRNPLKSQAAEHQASGDCGGPGVSGMVQPLI